VMGCRCHKSVRLRCDRSGLHQAGLQLSVEWRRGLVCGRTKAARGWRVNCTSRCYEARIIVRRVGGEAFSLLVLQAEPVALCDTCERTIEFDTRQ
jgi:hypothetical protein